MATTKNVENQQLQEELIELLLKKAGTTRKNIYSVAIKKWAVNNLDLLTPSEKSRYESIIL
jgi:hypothetical protein